jgi:hypothetical protein
MANTKTTNRNVSFFIPLLSFALSSIRKFRFSDYLDSPYKGFYWGAQGESGEARKEIGGELGASANCRPILAAKYKPRCEGTGLVASAPTSSEKKYKRGY